MELAASYYPTGVDADSYAQAQREITYAHRLAQNSLRAMPTRPAVRVYVNWPRMSQAVRDRLVRENYLQPSFAPFAGTPRLLPGQWLAGMEPPVLVVFRQRLVQAPVLRRAYEL